MYYSFNTLLLINTFFSFYLLIIFHNFFAWTMLISHIIQVLLCITHQLIFIFHFFSSTHFPPLWMVDAMFIFIKVFISSYFRSVWHPFSCFILRIVYFVLFCVTSLGPSHFPSCSSHTDILFSKFLHPEYVSQCCKYTLTDPPAPKIDVHTPSTANAF